MQLPRVVYIKLEVAPASLSNFGILYLGVISQGRIAEQQVGNTVAGVYTAALDSCLLITATTTDARFVFKVVTEESAEFQVV